MQPWFHLWIRFWRNLFIAEPQKDLSFSLKDGLFFKCCPWCDQTYGSRTTLYRHKNERHSLEFKASQLKNSDPDEETFVRCICCNLWTLNNSQSIKSHESSALHKSRQPVPNKKRKSEASSSQQFPLSSSLSNESVILEKKVSAESLYPSSAITSN